MSSRTGRAYLAKTTLEVMEVGHYVNPRGETEAIAADMAACNAGSACFEPDTLGQMRDAVLRTPVPFSKVIRTAGALLPR